MENYQSKMSIYCQIDYSQKVNPGTTNFEQGRVEFKLKYKHKISLSKSKKNNFLSQRLLLRDGLKLKQMDC